MVTNALSFFSGFEIANDFIEHKLKSDEVKQGKNYYLSAVPLALQWISLARLNGRLISYIPSKIVRISAQGLSGISICLSLPTSLFLACVKHSHYKRIAYIYNQFIPELKEDYDSFLIAKLPNNLPIQLNHRTLRVVHFLADHAGGVMQTAMVITGIGLNILGQTFFARGLLTGLTYGILDNRGWIPRRVSLFTETYTCVMGSIGMLYTGKWLDQAYAIIFQAISLFPKSQLFVQSKLDVSISWYFRHLSNNLPKDGQPFQEYLLQGPSVAEIDGKFNGPRDLTYTEIKNVIESCCEYEINISHCTNFVKTHNLPKDKNFDKLLQFFRAIDWTKKFNLLKAKLSKEDRFIDFLQENYKNIPKEDLKKNIDVYIADLANKEGISKEKYAAMWVEEQISALVNILTGCERGKGSQQDLQDAINICPEIVAYLQQMRKQVNDKIEYEDSLLKLALEAGNYCNRGIKRTFSEMQSQAIYKHSSNVKYQEDDPLKQYELKLLQSLQNLRYRIMLETYQKKVASHFFHNTLFQDTHAFDTYRSFFSLGFYPFTEYERKNFGILELIQWKLYFKQCLQPMYNKYLSELFNEIEKNEKEASYIEYKIIKQNPNLSPSQKEELLNWYGNIDLTGQPKDIEEKSRYLLLMTLGVLKTKRRKIRAPASK